MAKYLLQYRYPSSAVRHGTLHARGIPSGHPPPDPASRPRRRGSGIEARDSDGSGRYHRHKFPPACQYHGPAETPGGRYHPSDWGRGVDTPSVRTVCPRHQTRTSTPTRRILLLQVPIPCLGRWAAQAGSRANLGTLTARQPSPARRSRSPWYVREAGIVRLAPSTLMAARRALGVLSARKELAPSNPTYSHR